MKYFILLSIVLLGVRSSAGTMGPGVTASPERPPITYLNITVDLNGSITLHVAAKGTSECKFAFTSWSEAMRVAENLKNMDVEVSCAPNTFTSSIFFKFKK